MVLKYEKEIDEIIRFCCYESWMSEDEYQEITTDIFNLIGSSKEKLSEDIETGVKNGYSVESQIAIIKQVLTKN